MNTAHEPESKAEQVERVRQITTGDRGADLSDNDLAALGGVLADRDALLAACVEAYDWLSTHGDNLPASAMKLAPALRAAIAKATLVLVLLLLPSVVYADDKPFTVAKMAFALAAAADGTTTMYAIASGRVTEANPILKPFQRQPLAFGLVQATGSACLLYTVQQVHRRHPRWATAILVGATAGEALLTVRTVRMVTR